MEGTCFHKSQSNLVWKTENLSNAQYWNENIANFTVFEDVQLLKGYQNKQTNRNLEIKKSSVDSSTALKSGFLYSVLSINFCEAHHPCHVLMGDLTKEPRTLETADHLIFQW